MVVGGWWLPGIAGGLWRACWILFLLAEAAGPPQPVRSIGGECRCDQSAHGASVLPRSVSQGCGFRAYPFIASLIGGQPAAGHRARILARQASGPLPEPHSLISSAPMVMPPDPGARKTKLLPGGRSAADSLAALPCIDGRAGMRSVVPRVAAGRRRASAAAVRARGSQQARPCLASSQRRPLLTATRPAQR